MIPEKKVLSMLGLARRAGKVVSGEFSTEKAVKTGKAFLAIVAVDASENTQKMFRDMCRFYEVPLCVIGTKEELGHAIGQQMRASAAVTDENFAHTILKMTKNEIDGGGKNGDRE